MRKRLLSTLSVLFGLLVLTAAPAMAQGHGHDRDNRPPGWDHGRKAGWGHCDLPPGLAKKRGCIATRYRLVRYPVEHGSFVVVRVPVDYRGWYRVDDRHRLWVNDRGFWRDDRARFRLSIVID